MHAPRFERKTTQALVIVIRFAKRASSTSCDSDLSAFATYLQFPLPAVQNGRRQWTSAGPRQMQTDVRKKRKTPEKNAYLQLLKQLGLRFETSSLYRSDYEIWYTEFCVFVKGKNFLVRCRHSSLYSILFETQPAHKSRKVSLQFFNGIRFNITIIKFKT